MKLHGLAPLATDLHLRMTCGTKTLLAAASSHAQQILPKAGIGVLIPC